MAMASNTDIILDSIADGVFTVDPQWRITSFNAAAERITGIPRSEAIGRLCAEVFRATVCEHACVLRRTMETGKPVAMEEISIVRSDGETIPVSVSTALLRDERGEVIGGVETFRDLSVIEELRRELLGSRTFHDIVSADHEMHRIFDIMPQIAASESTVLIEGESGTGKELFARALHNLSPRAGGPIVTVNCGALPETLLEAELFGYRKGAFTDARTDKPGRFALAAGGTVFLDEIGDISPATQVKLLRVLQERTFEPLGATAPVRADVRIITATNRDLDRLVAGGSFRRDLFYRINVVRLRIPPLRERRGDIPLLVDHFIGRFNRLRARSIAGVTADVMAVLMAHDFPGNVRELENVIEYAFVLCRSGQIGIRHLPANLQPRRDTGAPPASSLDELEGRLILDALERSGFNRERAAAELGIHKTTLWRKIRSLGLRLPPADGRGRRSKRSDARDRRSG
ncbi:MAG: sigma 54-interacting transcriptional regulator [Candidatus Krumholzibacteria bacterium]|nr:sigma 54-interacting transcriptional regulator [Candidatus Krumholzibacteria bacterium]